MIKKYQDIKVIELAGLIQKMTMLLEIYDFFSIIILNIIIYFK